MAPSEQSSEYFVWKLDRGMSHVLRSEEVIDTNYDRNRRTLAIALFLSSTPLSSKNGNGPEMELEK